MTKILSAIKWIKKEHNGAHAKAKTVRLSFCYTIYWTWRMRNKICFEKAKITVDEMVKQIKYMVYKVIYSMYPIDRITF
ncbi:unnamed protein product [Cuscuta europaea]|uniref:Uncharacterized protein n=1 Tax=Cuscuta europaea TaxID=41803 RepID=A0A9P1EIV4_CUSEU|nr:unnamed protein product [Cuscuta europaea]